MAIKNKKVDGKFLFKSKKAQVTIFIILSIAISIVLVLLFVGQDRLITIITGEAPIDQIKNCIQEPFEKAVEVVSEQGGSLEPKNFYLYRGNRVEYLCYTEEDYKKCIMQKPLLKQSIEKELQRYIQPKVQSCINGVKNKLQDEGYVVSSKIPEISVSLIPNNIILDIKSDLRIEKEGSEFYETIKVDLNSKLYTLIMIANSINNWEARYGDSESLIYMGYYPSLKVEKKKQSEGTTIYTISDRNSLDKFRFATRSVVIPPGAGI